MARLARVVVAGRPHHVTQRGNRRQAVFFGEEDSRADTPLLGEWCRRHAVGVWADCLMTRCISWTSWAMGGPSYRAGSRTRRFNGLKGTDARRPLGEGAFVKELAQRLGRAVARGKPGPRPGSPN